MLPKYARSISGRTLERELHWDEVKCRESTALLIAEWKEFSEGAEVVWFYAPNKCDFLRMSLLLGDSCSIPWQDATTSISRHIISTDFTSTDKPYARSRSLKHLNEAMLFENEKPLEDGNMNLGPTPRKVRKDVEILWRLILLAKYIVAKGESARKSEAYGGTNGE
ncbi:hypothetical protein HK104_005285 [Borealophlyctis nickersoniae]|nr:hypothetical protein HK104_005285 [Borealophlyctis nickersoniae]